MNIEIRILASGDEGMLGHVAAGVFDHDVDPDLTAEFLRDPRHHLAVALEGTLVVGFASAVDYVHPDKPRELWINEVGVAPSHQRQGIGRRLLAAFGASSFVRDSADSGWPFDLVPAGDRGIAQCT